MAAQEDMALQMMMKMFGARASGAIRWRPCDGTGILGEAGAHRVKLVCHDADVELDFDVQSNGGA